MSMEKEFDGFVIEPFLGEGIDLDYEFDAPRFYDFTQQEMFWEAVEAELWFASASSYPPSPIVLKLRWESHNSKEILDTSTSYRDGESLNNLDDDPGYCMETEVSAVVDDERGLEFYNHTMIDTLQGKSKSPGRSIQLRGSTLMKPTASYLAKQKNPQEVHIQTAQIFRRLQKQNSLIVNCQATKRQKLETGYLRKATHLRHQALFTHKASNKTDVAEVNLNSRPQVTIPQQPELETARRAQLHRCRIDAELGGQTKSSSHTFKARQLNRKIPEALSISSYKTTPQLPKFNARSISSRNSVSNSDTRHPIRPNFTNASKQESSRMVSKLRASPHNKRLSSKEERGVFRSIKEENALPMELKFTNNKEFLKEPPTELLSKLSLVSEVKQTSKSQSKHQPISKGLKENRPESFLKEHEFDGLSTLKLLEDGLGQRKAENLWEAVSTCE